MLSKAVSASAHHTNFNGEPFLPATQSELDAAERAVPPDERVIHTGMPRYVRHTMPERVLRTSVGTARHSRTTPPSPTTPRALGHLAVLLRRMLTHGPPGLGPAPIGFRDTVDQWWTRTKSVVPARPSADARVAVHGAMVEGVLTSAVTRYKRLSAPKAFPGRGERQRWRKPLAGLVG